MIRVQFYIVLLVCLSINGWAQVDSGIANSHSIPDIRNIKGDSARAIKSKHHEYNGNELIAQLGYIDTIVAIDQEFRDNLEVGLRTLPSSDYEIVSFEFGYDLQGGCDYQGPYSICGNKIPNEIMRYLGGDKYRFRSGDKFYIDDIRVRRKGAGNTHSVKPIYIKIIDQP